MRGRVLEHCSFYLLLPPSSSGYIRQSKVQNHARSSLSTHFIKSSSAFSPGSQAALRRLFPDAILADAADAEVLGLNAVSDGRHVVLPAQATGLAAQLRERGYEPIGVDLSELRKAGGGPKCCTLTLRDREATR